MSLNFSTVKVGSRLGFGTMSMTWTTNPRPTEQLLETLKYVTTSPEFNVKFINGGEFYGAEDANLKLLKKFVDDNKPEFNRNLVISIKGGLDLTNFNISSSKEEVSRSIENIISYFPQDPSLRPKIIFESCRVDPKVPYEETIGSAAEYVKAGKIDGISISEVGVNSIRKAVGVFPISFIELEMSLMCQDLIFNGVLEAASELGIPVVAYSPLCRGYLTDSAAEKGDNFLNEMAKDDYRRRLGKFSEENLSQNMKLVKRLYEFAHDVKKTSLESLALSWILAISERKQYEGINSVTKIIPIPSGSTKERIKKNFTELLELTDDDLSKIKDICKTNEVKGSRYNEDHLHYEFA
ncbi:uncharacterized protein PRCAT00004274001 [Priceomyces carsonii]|uniref:uncharacterized protein n=1 Tax=Priceomyces carsonii TaxID=28549 RepID=UPI002ED983A1|nr:unnamed protein product [Priceomyces carsonii]